MVNSKKRPKTNPKKRPKTNPKKRPEKGLSIDLGESMEVDPDSTVEQRALEELESKLIPEQAAKIDKEFEESSAALLDDKTLKDIWNWLYGDFFAKTCELGPHWTLSEEESSILIHLTKIMDIDWILEFVAKYGLLVFLGVISAPRLIRSLRDMQQKAKEEEDRAMGKAKKGPEAITTKGIIKKQSTKSEDQLVFGPDGNITAIRE